MSLGDVHAFCDLSVDARFLTIGFRLVDTRDIGGVAHRRTYVRPGERFEADFYVEVTDPSVLGIKLRPAGSSPYGGSYVRRILNAIPPPSLSYGASLTDEDLDLQFRWEFDLMMRSLDQLRSCF